ncbi:MAG: hypothetical protein ACYDB7_07845 [Mycobacteriales bacterium]
MIERYEAVRTAALAGAPDGFGHGLALLTSHGLPAWLSVAGECPPAPPAAPRQGGRTAGAHSPGAGRELVRALAAMALAHS